MSRHGGILRKKRRKRLREACLLKPNRTKKRKGQTPPELPPQTAARLLAEINTPKTEDEE